MKNFTWWIYFVILILVVSCQPETNFYKGNLHAHSNWSDGDHYPEMAMDWYRSNGYQFAVLSDHNILQTGEKWIYANRNETTTEAYQKYLERFGEEWIEKKYIHDTLLVRLRTFDEYRGQFDEPGSFISILAEEITDQYNGKPVHMNAINLESLVPPQHGPSIVAILNKTAETIKIQEDSLDHSVFSCINHPNFGWAIQKEDLVTAAGFQFFEVFNGHPSVRNYGDSLHLSTEDLWDEVNIDRLERGIPLLLGIATDDTHHYHEFRKERANPGRGWVMVKAETLENSNIINGLKSGDFYASTGVVISDYKITSRRYSLEVKKDPGIEYTILFIGCMKGKKEAEILYEVKGLKALYRFSGDELFVRAKVISSKTKSNPFADGDVEVAWLQPVSY